MATKDWNGFKKSGDTYIPNDATARASISTIEGKIPNGTLPSNPLVNQSMLTNALDGKADVGDVISLAESISDIEDKIPSNASSSNQLATRSEVSAAYKPKGNATLATLPPLTNANLNNVYNMTEDFTTTADFAEGEGKEVKAGNEVGIINIATDPDARVIKYTVLGGFIDLSNYVQKSSTAGVIDNNGTIKSVDNFPQENSTNLVTSGGVRAATDEIYGTIAPIEGDLQSENAYAVGEHFLSVDGFCTAIQPIAVGDTLTKNVNYVEGTIDTAITELNTEINNLYSNIGILTTPVPSYVANTLPVLKRNITSAFYNGSLRGEIAAGNFKNVRAGDYIVGQATGSTYFVAMCDYRLGKGDQTNNANYPAYGTHHLGLMLFKPVGTTALWRGYGDANKGWRVSASDLGRCPWNAATDADPTDTEAIGTNSTNITRTYNSASVSGYMGSFIRERIDAILLPQCFQADFGSANVLKYREINGNTVETDKTSGGQGNWTGCTSGWSWYDRYLDLPSEIELYGSRVFGSAYDHGCQCEQLSMFRNAAIHDFYPRIDIWTKAVASSSYAALRSNFGNATNGIASVAIWACPLACVK